MLLTAVPALRKGSAFIRNLTNLGLTSGLKFCGDSGDLHSYAGSGELWTDVSGNGLDATNGISSGNTTNNFTFVGSAGNGPENAYWSSASSVFRLSLQSWMSDVHKDNGKLTLCAWTKSDVSGCGVFFNTMDSAGVFGGVAYPGFETGVFSGANGATAGALGFSTRRDDGQFSSFVHATTVVPSGWVFQAISIDEQAGSYIFQVNGTQETGSITYSSPSTSAGSRDGQYVRGNGGGGTPTYAYTALLALWNVGLSSSSLTSIYNATKGPFSA